MKLLNYLNKYNTKSILVITLFVVAASVVNKSWLYDPYGWVDQWGYFGEAYLFPKLIELFPIHPSSELLPVILPTAFFHKIFDPILANLLRDIFFLSTFLSILFLYLQKLTDTYTSFVIVFLAGGYQYLLTSIGSNYPVGAVIFYFMVALFLVSLARRQGVHNFLNPLFFSAVFFACMVYSAILSVSYLPCLFLLYILDFGDLKHTIFSILRKKTLEFIKNYFYGFSLTTLVFSAIYYPYSQKFFFTSNIQKLFLFVGEGVNSAPPFSLWLADASWLVIPSAITISSAIYLIIKLLKFNKFYSFIRSLEERDVIAFITVIVSAAMLFINVVIKQWSLQFLYFHQILPLYFLGLGVLMYSSKSNLKKIHLYFEVAIIAFLSLLTLYFLNYDHVTWADLRGYLKLQPYTALFLVFLFTVLLLVVLRFNYYIRWMALSWLIFFNLFSFSPTFGCFLCIDGVAKKSFPSALDSSEKIFLSTIEITKFLEEIDPKRKGSIWYNENDILGSLMRQSNAVFYLNMEEHRINKEFPSLETFINIDAPGSDGHKPIKGEILIVLSSNSGSFIKAKEALKKIKLNINTHYEYKLKLDISNYIYVTKIILE